MSQPAQFINGPDGTPAFAVIAYADYLALEDQEKKTPTGSSDSLLSEDGLYITLPHGGPGARLDLRQFIDAWVRRGTITIMAVNKRQQGLSKFTGEAVNSLDPILRRCFLPEGSPYVNSMQATTPVVEALVQTGVFRQTVESMPGFYRAVQCIAIDQERAVEFLRKHGGPDVEIDIHKFILP
jgi:hypothetical protein